MNTLSSQLKQPPSLKLELRDLTKEAEAASEEVIEVASEEATVEREGIEGTEGTEASVVEKEESSEEGTEVY